MKRFTVTLPVTGYCIINVEAESADAAIDAAMDVASNENLETWQTHKQITRGNVCYAEVHNASAELIEEDE